MRATEDFHKDYQIWGGVSAPAVYHISGTQTHRGALGQTEEVVQANALLLGQMSGQNHPPATEHKKGRERAIHGNHRSF